MMCHVSIRNKEEPYDLYGRLYRSLGGGAMSVVPPLPECLLEVPSNNKLLCRHPGIPLARKKPEAKARPHLPVFVTKNIGEKVESIDDDGIRHTAWEVMERKFHPVFWKGAISIFTNAPIVVDPKSIVGHRRPWEHHPSCHLLPSHNYYYSPHVTSSPPSYYYYYFIRPAACCCTRASRNAIPCRILLIL